MELLCHLADHFAFIHPSSRESLYKRMRFRNVRLKAVLSDKRFYSIAGGSGDVARTSDSLLMHSAKLGAFSEISSIVQL